MSKSTEYQVSIHLTEDEYNRFVDKGFVNGSSGCCGSYETHLVLEDVWQQIQEQILTQKDKTSG